MLGGGHDEVHADALADACEDGGRAHRELVAAVHLVRDIGLVPRRPVRLAVEAEARPSEAGLLFGQRDGTFDVRAPVGPHDRAVLALERVAQFVVVRLGRGGDAVTAQLAPPGVVRVDQLRERRRLGRVGLRDNQRLGRRGRQRLCQFGHPDLLSTSRSSPLRVERVLRLIKGPASPRARGVPPARSGSADRRGWGCVYAGHELGYPAERCQGANGFSTPRSAGSSSGKCRSRSVRIELSSTQSMPSFV